MTMFHTLNCTKPSLITSRRIVWTGLLLGVSASLTACKDGTKEASKGDTVSASASASAPIAKSTVVLPSTANAIEQLLFKKAPDCYGCGAAKCADAIKQVVEIPGNAAEGAAKGTAKSALAQSTLSCVLDKRCVANNASLKCYCGDKTGIDCISPDAANGPCKSVIESGLELTDPTKIAMNYTKPETGAGAALGLVLCLIDNRCNACF